jgi:hypothetical protein
LSLEYGPLRVRELAFRREAGRERPGLKPREAAGEEIGQAPGCFAATAADHHGEAAERFQALVRQAIAGGQREQPSEQAAHKAMISRARQCVGACDPQHGQFERSEKGCLVGGVEQVGGADLARLREVG